MPVITLQPHVGHALHTALGTAWPRRSPGPRKTPEFAREPQLPTFLTGLTTQTSSKPWAWPRCRSLGEAGTAFVHLCPRALAHAAALPPARLPARHATPAHTHEPMRVVPPSSLPQGGREGRGCHVGHAALWPDPGPDHG